MKNIFTFIKSHKIYFLIGVPVLVIVLLFSLGGGAGDATAYTVENKTVTQSVLLSGKVMTSDRADLGFAASGRVSKISVKNNQTVKQGQVLAQLEIGELLADLKIKQLNSQTSNVDLEEAKENLQKVTTQENTKVASAYRTLLTEDLELIPAYDNYDVEVPAITGIYNGKEGQYKIRITKEFVTSDDFTLLTFNLENTEEIIEEEGPTKLGTKGLYISFSDEVASYQETTWFMNIPNKAGDSYLVNFNAYEEAKDARDLAIQNAEFEYQKLLTEEGGGYSVALAEIQKIQAEIRKNTIYAPFDGKVTNIEKEVGENASVGERVISILGEDKLEVVLQVSELDVAKLSPGLSIDISIDAIPGEIFEGTLKTVNSRETEIDGVPVYEAFVELKPDARIKTGMSANGVIILAGKENVITIPSYVIKKVDNKNFVEVLLEDGKTEDREITLGLLGTDSMVEVTSGLTLGEKIVSNTNEK